MQLLRQGEELAAFQQELKHKNQLITELEKQMRIGNSSSILQKELNKCLEDLKMKTSHIASLDSERVKVITTIFALKK